MAGRKRGEIGGTLARGRDRFEAWRQSRHAGARIPEKLWSLAIRLVDAHGLSRTASVLRLDHNSLKKRVAANKSESSSAVAAFIELAAPSPVASGECVVEFADGSGASMRVHLRGCDTPDLVALGRSFWSAE